LTEQPGVKAPGTAKRTTFLLAHSMCTSVSLALAESAGWWGDRGKGSRGGLRGRGKATGKWKEREVENLWMRCN